MFRHNFKYDLITTLRVKEVIIWLIIYPIALGTFFKVAFGNIYNNDIKFTTVKTAVVVNSEESGRAFRQIAEKLENEDDAMFSFVYTDKDDAMKQLKDEDVRGIIFVDDQLSLTVSSNSLKSTMLERLVEKYNLNAKIIGDTASSDPTKIEAVTNALTEEISSIKSEALSQGNTNMYDQYFYNLLGMVALFGTITGLHVATHNQGNLSSLGARKCISPTPKSKTILSCLCATFVVQAICMVISLTFIITVLRVDMGNRLPLVYLTSILAGTVGSSMGFFIGSVGRFGESTKDAICTAVSLLLCFASGLMDASIKQKIAESSFAWFNKVNPAAVICESFFSLNIYKDYTRYIQCVVTMIITTVVFVTLGLIMTRRRKYASL